MVSNGATNENDGQMMVTISFCSPLHMFDRNSTVGVDFYPLAFGCYWDEARQHRSFGKHVHVQASLALRRLSIGECGIARVTFSSSLWGAGMSNVLTRIRHRLDKLWAYLEVTASQDAMRYWVLVFCFFCTFFFSSMTIFASLPLQV